MLLCSFTKCRGSEHSHSAETRGRWGSAGVWQGGDRVSWLALPRRALGHGTCQPGQRSPLYAPALQQQVKRHEIVAWWIQPFSQYVTIFKRKLFQIICVRKRKALKMSKCRDNTETLPFLKPCKIQDEGLGVQCQSSLLRYCL